MIDPTFFSKLDAMMLKLKRHAFGKYQGEQKTAYVGDGLTFKDYTPYNRGDDFRKIDWKVYARTKELFTRRYEADKNLTLHIILDATASMNYQNKFHFASLMALGIAHLAQRNQERVEFSIFTDKIIPLKFQSQNIRVQGLMQKLNKVKPHGNADFTKTMTQYKQRVKSKSLIFIVSDFLYPIEDINNLISMYGKSELFFIQALHEDEISLPFQGDTKFINPENPDTKVKTYVSNKLRKLYIKELLQHTLSIKKACTQRAKYIQLDTRTEALKSFIKMWSSI